MSNPYKGEIHDWHMIRSGTGVVVLGRPVGHPEFINWIKTSLVVRHEIGEGDQPDFIETLNSRYKLVGPELSLSEVTAKLKQIASPRR